MLREAIRYVARHLSPAAKRQFTSKQKGIRLDIETLEMRWLPAFYLGSATYTVNETARYVAVEVWKDSGAGSVDYSTSSGTATSGSDFTATSGTLTMSKNPGSAYVYIPITDDNLSDTGENFTFTLSNPTGGHSLGTPSSATITINDATSSYSVSGQQRVIDHFQGERYPFGDASIGMQTGDYSLVHGFDYGRGGAVFAQPALVYHSDTTTVRPIVEATVTKPSGETPTSSEARFTWNGGSPGSWVSYSNPSGGDDRWVYGFQVSSGISTTGLYPWTIEVKQHFSGNLGDVYRTYSGNALVVAHDASAMGAGWSIDGFNQLVAVTGGVMMVYGGGGSARLFTGSGGTYTSPANDYGTLVKNGDNTYTYTSKEQMQWNYDTTGKLVTIVDPHSLSRTFTYSSGLLSTVAEPDGGVTTFTYSSGKLATIVQPGTRTITITINGSNDLTTIADADGSLRTFMYDANHDLTNAKWGLVNTTMTYSGTTGLLTNVDRGNGHTLAFTAGSAVPLGTTPVARWGDVNSAVNNSGLSLLTVTLDQAGRLTNYNGDLPSGGGGAQMIALPGGGISSSITRDSAGNVTVFTDALGRTTSYTFDGAGDLTQIQHPDNSLETFTYDSTFHTVLTHRDTLNRRTTFTYNGTGDLTSVQDALSQRTTYSWSSGLLQSVENARGHLTSFSYDGSRRLQTSQNALSEVVTYSYDSAGNVQTVTDELGRVTTFSYDAKHRLLTMVDALSGRTTYTYNMNGQVTSVADPLNRVTSLVYNAQGFNTSVTNGVGSGLDRTTTYTYLANGWVSTVANALNQVTTYAYTVYGDVAAVTDSLGNRNTFTYDNAQQVTQVADGLNNLTTYTYNNRGWVTEVQNALNNRTTFTYDTEGNRLTSKDANLGITTVSYDARNRVTSVTDPLSHTSTTVYDAVDNVIATIDALGHRTTYTFDAVQQLQTVKNALSNVTTYTYDSVGNLTTIKDALNNVTTYVYDDLHRRVNTIEPNGSKTTFIYDAASQMTGLTDPNTNRTTFVFDALGRQTQEIDALNKTITYTYNAIDQLTQKNDRKSQTIDYTYDDAGRLTNQVWKNSGGTTTNRVTYTYDNAGHLLTARDTNGAYTFTYDAAGQMLTQKDMWSTTLTFTYDNVGNRTKVQDSFSGVETSTYDAANRLTSRKFGGVGGTSHRLEFTYTNANQLENIKRYNAASGGSLIGQTTFTYDTLLRMAGIKNANGGGTVLSQFTYTYDAVNRLTTEVLGGNTKTFTYDVRSQLTGDGTSTYGYDSAGNRNNSSQTIASGNRLDLDANWDYSYDDEGNLTGKTSVATPTVTWTYTWDVNNRMVAAVKSAGSSLYNVDYKYDVFGNRIEQIEDADGAGGGASVTTRFAWEGAGVLQDAWGNRTSPVGTENWNIWADLNGSNGLVMRYVRGDEVDQLFSRVKADGTVAHYLTDRMQSTRQMLDASGTVANTITYDGFGNVLSETDAAFGDRWKWTGREYNNYTGLQYNRARYYSGESGRWVSEDPIKLGAGDYNIFRYTLSNAPNRIDPSGYIAQGDKIDSNRNGLDRKTGIQDNDSPIYEVGRIWRIIGFPGYLFPIEIPLSWLVPPYLQHSVIVIRNTLTGEIFTWSFDLEGVLYNHDWDRVPTLSHPGEWQSKLYSGKAIIDSIAKFNQYMATAPGYTSCHGAANFLLRDLRNNGNGVLPGGGRSRIVPPPLVVLPDGWKPTLGTQTAE